MKNKRMVEPIFGKRSQRKAEVKILISEKIEFKAKSVEQKTMMSLLYCKVYSPRWSILNILKSKYGSKSSKRKTAENKRKTEMQQ